MRIRLKTIKPSWISILALAALFNLSASSVLAAADTTSAEANKPKVLPTAAGFKDTLGHWAEAEITTLQRQGIISGYEDLTFKPNQLVTRTEAVVMLVRILGSKDNDPTSPSPAAPITTTASELSDSSIPVWAAESFNLALNRGILSATDKQSFRPNQPAKRIEIAAMAAKGLGLGPPAPNLTSSDLDYVDAADIPKAQRGYVQLVTESELMVGNPDRTFQPSKTITRAEMAALLVRMDNLRIDNYLKAAEAADYDLLRGTLKTIVTVDEQTNFVITVAGSDLTLELADEPLIRLDRRTASLRELKPGQRATLTLKAGQVIDIEANAPDLQIL